MLTGRQVAADLDRLLHTFDQPTGDGINTYYVSQAAHNGGVKVALSGLGGDELFGGYPSFRDLPRIARLLPAWRTLPEPWRRAITRRLARSGVRPRKLADFLTTPGTCTDSAPSSGVSSRSGWAMRCCMPTCGPVWPPDRAIPAWATCRPSWRVRIRSRLSAPGSSAPTWPTCCSATATS